MWLLSHKNWENGDIKKLQEKKAIDAHYVRCLTSFLKGCPENCGTLNEFLELYPQHHLCRCGDLIRIILRHSDVFKFDRPTKVIELRKVPQPPKNPFLTSTSPPETQFISTAYPLSGNGSRSVSCLEWNLACLNTAYSPISPNFPCPSLYPFINPYLLPVTHNADFRISGPVFC